MGREVPVAQQQHSLAERAQHAASPALRLKSIRAERLARPAPVTGAIVVTTPSDVSLEDARKAVMMFHQVKVPILGMVENMSYLSCPHCHERIDVFSHGGGRRTAQEMNVHFLGELPLDPAVRVGGDSGKPIVRQQGKAYMFSSPAIVGDVVFIGVLNGTLEARDAKTGELLWDFQVDASKRNNGWVLTADRKLNGPFLFHSSWREAPIVATDEQFRIGGIFSSPLVVNGVVYFGCADGFLYALE